MQFAVNVPTSAGASEYSNLAFCDEIAWEKQRDYARLVEELGFDGVAVPDHLMTGDGATTECLTTLTGLAEATDEVYLYPKTVNNHLRHPPMLAKACATLDGISDGRLKLGMGAGWKDDEARASWPTGASTTCASGWASTSTSTASATRRTNWSRWRRASR